MPEATPEAYSINTCPKPVYTATRKHSDSTFSDPLEAIGSSFGQKTENGKPIPDSSLDVAIPPISLLSESVEKASKIKHNDKADILLASDAVFAPSENSEIISSSPQESRSLPIESSFSSMLDHGIATFESIQDDISMQRINNLDDILMAHPAGGTTIQEGHVNYYLMYDMLTGIRISVSRCENKPLARLSADDFTAAHKLAFDSKGNELIPTSKYDFKFKDYAPSIFRRIRDLFHVDPKEYLSSLTGKYILSELGSPGKSGSFFYYSRDYRFIIKTIRPSEKRFLLKILNSYHSHAKNNPHTLICRIFGLHRVKQPGNRKIHFVVMGNVFPPNKDIHHVFDLKGSTHGRCIDEKEVVKHPDAVMKDLNWIRQGRAIQLGPEKSTLFKLQLERDVKFLVDHGVMDYSLLIGIHDVTVGNKTQVRNQVLSEFSPSTDHVVRRNTTITRGKSARSLSEIELLKPVSNLSEDIPKERMYCIFYQDQGGLRATDHLNLQANEVYFMGIIDIFTSYSALKRLETFFKSMTSKRSSISAVNPKFYGGRFISFITDAIQGPQAKRSNEMDTYFEARLDNSPNTEFVRTSSRPINVTNRSNRV